MDQQTGPGNTGGDPDDLWECPPDGFLQGRAVHLGLPAAVAHVQGIQIVEQGVVGKPQVSLYTDVPDKPGQDEQQQDERPGSRRP